MIRNGEAEVLEMLSHDSDLQRCFGVASPSVDVSRDIR